MEITENNEAVDNTVEEKPILSPDIVEEKPTLSPDTFNQNNANILKTRQQESDTDLARALVDAEELEGDDDNPFEVTEARWLIFPSKNVRKLKKKFKGVDKQVPDFLIKKRAEAAAERQTEDIFYSTQGVSAEDVALKTEVLKATEVKIKTNKDKVAYLEGWGADAKAINEAKAEIVRLEKILEEGKRELLDLTDNGQYSAYIKNTYADDLVDAPKVDSSTTALADDVLTEGGAVPIKPKPKVFDDVDGAVDQIFVNLKETGGALEDFTVKGVTRSGEEIEYLPRDIWDYIEAVSQQPEFKTIVNSQKRGVLKDDAILELANTLHVNPNKLKETILKTKAGELWNDETMQAARMVLVDEARRLKLLSKNLQSNPSDKGRIAFMMQLELLNQIQARIIGVKTEYARALRGLQRTAEGSKTEKLLNDELQDIIRTHGGDKNIDGIAKAVSEALGPEDILAVSKDKSIWAKGYDAANEARIESLLSSPVTQVKNLTSAWALISEEMVYISRTAAKEQAKAAKNPGYVPLMDDAEAFAYWWGLKAGMDEAWKATKLAYKTGVQVIPGQKWNNDPRRTNAFSAEGFGLEDGPIAAAADFAGRVVTLNRVPTRALSAGDQFNKNIAYNAKLYQLTMRKMNELGKKVSDPDFEEVFTHYLVNPSDEVLEAAVLHAKEVTLVDDLSKGLQLLDKIAHSRFGNIFIPFARIPLRAAEWSASRLPGLQRLSGKYKAAKAKGGAEWSKMKTQTNLMAALGLSLMFMGATGKCTGPEPSNPKQAALNRARNIMPMSCKVGNTWRSYRNLEPLSTAFGIFVGLGELAAHPDMDSSTMEELLAGGISVTIDVFQDMTLLQNFVDMVDAVSAEYGVTHQIDKLFSQYKNQYIPNAVKVGAGWIDDTVRFEKESKHFWDVVSADYGRYAPWYSKKGPAKIDHFGEPIIKPQTVFIGPIPTWLTKQDQKKLVLSDGSDALEELAKIPGVGFPRKWPETFYFEGMHVDIQNNKILSQLHRDAGVKFKERFTEYMEEYYPDKLEKYNFHNKDFFLESDRITEIFGSSFTGGDPGDTETQKKAVRDEVNADISELFRNSYIEASLYFQDNHPDLWIEIEEKLKALGNAVGKVYDETETDVKTKTKFNVR